MAKKKTAKRKPAKHTSKQPSAKTETTADHDSAVQDSSATAGAQPGTAPRQSKYRFPVVGIGASAGGLEAIDELLDHMPAQTGMSFVVITHQHPGHKSLLPELLGKHTAMPVVQASDGSTLKPNHVYVSPPSVNLALLNGALHVMESGEPKGTRVPLPIDYFFRSLAADRQEQAICIVLSGTGSDGTLGLKAIKAESGMAMAQQPQSAKYAGMPSSAIATGLVDYVLPVSELPAQLVAYADGPYLQGGVPSKEPLLPTEPMQKIFLLLRSRTGHDFSAYKTSTLCRRIERRMSVHQIEGAAHYVRYLHDCPHEIDLLFKELLISVTSFFRDAPAFESLTKGPIAQLVESKKDGDTIRGWIPGCATGEEVYSLAILIREAMEKANKHFDLQIFGTDLDSDAIETARVGKYPHEIGGDILPTRLARYFVREDSSYRIRKEVREMVVFAPQNVIKDPPFTKLDFLSCRNMLIYLNADLQKRLMPIFHYSIKPGGFLFLGPSESIGQFENLFEPVDKKWKIYRCKETVAVAYSIPDMPAGLPLIQYDGVSTIEATSLNKGTQTRLSTLIERQLLQEFCPASVVVNDRGEIIHVHGETGEYLQLAEGQIRTNVLDMARKGLTHELGSMLRQIATGKNEVIRKHVPVKSNDAISIVDLSVKRIEAPESIRGLLRITFRTVPDATDSSNQSSAADTTDESRSHIHSLEAMEQELHFMRESNRGSLEEIETANEELKSTNEELQSTNEEMQSTNEELETSKEEMHSLNEELITVNAELQSKLDDFAQVNDDMANLLNSIDVATIFLDGDLNIKRFTEESKSLIMMRDSDIGRPICELVSNLEYQDLLADCRSVLKTLNNVEVDVRSTDGRWHLMKIMPYRTAEQVIDGVVITLVEISLLMEGRDALAFSQSIVNTVHGPLVILDENLKVNVANQAFYETFKTNANQSVGEFIYDLGSAQWDVDELRKLLEDVLPQNDVFEKFKITATFPKIGVRSFLLNGRQLERAKGLPKMILLAMAEVTSDDER